MEEPKVKENSKERIEYTEEERMAKKYFRITLQNFFMKSQHLPFHQTERLKNMRCLQL